MAEEEQELDEAVDEAGGSKKKKMIMIAGGVVFLLIAAGAGLYFTGFFEEEAPVAVELSEASKSDSSEKETDESEEVEGDDAPEIFYQALKPPFMVNFPGGNIKVIKVAMSIMAKDEAVIDAIKLHDPVIRNNILMMLSGEDPEVLKTEEGKVQLQAAVKVEINKLLAERKVSSKVNEVFFTDLVMQ